MLWLPQLTLALGIFQLLLMNRICSVTSEDLLELSCLVNGNQCEQFQQTNIEVKCVNEQCECTKVDSGEHTKCTPKDIKQGNIIAGPCPCTQPHAECDTQEGICYCKPHYMASSDRRRCIPVAVPLTDDCELDKQCHALNTFSACHPDEMVCSCRKDFMMHQGGCLSTLLAGCFNDTDCGSCGASICLENAVKCVCNSGYVSTRNLTKCQEGLNYGAPCVHHRPCQLTLGPGGSCNNGICACGKQYFASQVKSTDDENMNKVICQPLVVFGEYCRNNSDCYQHQLTETEQSMECGSGECRCKIGYHSENNLNCTFNHSQSNLFTNLLTLISILQLLRLLI